MSITAQDTLGRRVYSTPSYRPLLPLSPICICFAYSLISHPQLPTSLPTLWIPLPTPIHDSVPFLPGFSQAPLASALRSCLLKPIHRRVPILSHLQAFTPVGAASCSNSFHSLTQPGKAEPIHLSPAKSRGIRTLWGREGHSFLSLSSVKGICGKGSCHHFTETEREAQR